MKYFLLCKGRVVLLVLISFTLTQNVKSQSSVVQTAVHFDVSAPLRDMKAKKPAFWKKWMTETEKEIPNKFHIKPVIHPEYMNRPDGAMQNLLKKEAMGAIINPVINFDGINNSKNKGRFTPPDPAGDVGPNHYVQAVNCMLQIFSKTGSSVFGPVETSTLWSGFTGDWDGHNDGDAVVMYDENADRWIISQFAVDCGTSPNLTEYELVAVSQTADPTGSYYRYAFKFDYMPDYPKMGVWSDGYYLAVNRFNTNNSSSPPVGAGMAVLERDKMLTGDASARMIYVKTETQGGSGSGKGSECFNMLPGDCDGTFAPSGTPNFFTYINDDSWGGNDELRIWSLKPNWTAGTAVASFVTALPVAAFAIFPQYKISQKGVSLKLDDLSDRLMHRLQYRNMGTYESMVTCHSVSILDSIAAVRWYEMRKNGNTWTLYQQGTYTFADSKSRWLGSIAMNGNGDIALGYNLSSTNDFPSIYITGRKATDAPGTMTIAESPIKIGAASMTGLDRWGDYAMMSVDPVDNKTFWHTNEYVGTYGGSYPWSTRIASFVLSNTPLAETLPATSITGTSATLNGTVNPNGLATDYYFKWGITSSYGNVTPTLSAGTVSTVVPVYADITGLTPATIYHYSLVATNSDGTAIGKDFTLIGGQAEVVTAGMTNITATTATGGGNVTANGGSEVTRGICWGIAANPTVTDAKTTDGTGLGTFTSAIAGLAPATLYHVRAYASNGAGTVYGNDVTFTSGSLSTPVSTDATAISSTGFTANWNAVDGATSYNLDVSLYPTFSIGGGSATVTEGFNNGVIAPAGWTFTNIADTYITTGNYGLASPSLKMDATGDAVETTTLASSATEVSFWCKGQSVNASSSLLIEGYNGNAWITIDTYSPLPTVATTKIYNSSSIPALPADIIKFRLSYSKSTGNLALDDISLTSGGTVPSFVNGYESLTVNGNSKSITGLTAATPYYYRVRAKSGSISSESSNVINVSTTGGGTIPALFVTPVSLTSFTYVPGSGPSASKTFNLSGINLTGAPGTITVTGSASYEVSTDNSTFSASVNIPYSAATLAASPVFVRLKAGLSAGNYNAEIITNEGGGATPVNVLCSGSVSVQADPAIIAGTLAAFSDQIINTVSAEQSFTVSGTSLVADITLTPLSGFEISSTSGSGFVANPNTLTLTQTGGVISSALVYVRFAPTSVQAYSGNISLTSTGSISQNVAVSGAGINASATPQLVISQVYGGGGNTGANYKNDFIELFNRGTSSVNLGGWSVQYASATGTTWTNKTTLTNITLAPGQYCLIQEAAGTGGTTALPTPDVTGTIAMSGTAGKVALVNNNTLLASSCLAGNGIVDFVGYSTTASCFEGTGPTPAVSNTTAAIRLSNGCTDTDDNKADFTAGPPTPRNSASTMNPCSIPSPVLTVTPSTLSGFIYLEGNGPSSAKSYNLGGSNLTSPGTIVVTGSVDYEVSADNSSFGGSVNVTFASPILASTPIYVRLKAGLNAGSYNTEIITNIGGGAPTINTTCNGNVITSLAAPVALAATDITSGGFSANWNASAGAAAYQLDVATDNAFVSPVSGYNNLDVSNVLTYGVTGLTYSTPYYYRVRAYAGTSVSDNSNAINATTLLNTGFNFDEKALSDAYSYQNTVFINNKDNTKGEFFIYTSAGKLVYSAPAVQGITRYYLNKPGVYIVKVLTLNLNMAKKVVIR